MPQDNCMLIDLQPVNGPLGNITIVESMRQVPFEIRRVYYLYNLPISANRTPHGHRQLQQLLVAINGSFDITVDDGVQKRIYRLDNPGFGLYIPQKIWRDIRIVSPETIILVFASELYDELDYYREYDVFFDGTCLKT